MNTAFEDSSTEADEPVAVDALAAVQALVPTVQPRVKPPGSGRRKGTPNAASRDMRAHMMKQGRPFDFICACARGRRIRHGSDWYYPTTADRKWAAELLSRKLVSDLQSASIALSGPDGGPIDVQAGPPMDPIELARSLAFILTSAAHKVQIP